MIDHISFSVKNFDESLKFYDETLAILGVERMMNFETEEYRVAGYGRDGKPFFWISIETSPNEEESVGKARGFHVAFTSSSVDEVRAWYQKCLELGGTDNGEPGPRPHYHPGYYGAFIIDPNGWRIEAAFHGYKEND
ncbi:MAG: hypothetical protein K940chlam3_01380 [Chlamydiae bacterium]|nr:hypothetical protein [Chlamydiota bacterium]